MGPQDNVVPGKETKLRLVGLPSSLLFIVTSRVKRRRGRRDEELKRLEVEGLS